MTESHLTESITEPITESSSQSVTFTDEQKAQSHEHHRKHEKKQTVLVTGASKGIGKAFCEIFAKNGYDLILVSRDKDLLSDLAIELKRSYGCSVTVIPRDLSTPLAAQALFETLKRNHKHVDILVNNAGFGGMGEHIDRESDDELGMIQLNITALTMLSKLIGKDMAKHGSGKILNVASVAGFIPGPYSAVYFASKAYVVSYSTALAYEMKKHKVTVSVLCPGSTDTPFFERAFGGKELPKAFKHGMMSASAVATIGYKGLMKGTLIIVPGFMNKIMVCLSRFIPRKLVCSIMERMQTSRTKVEK